MNWNRIQLVSLAVAAVALGIRAMRVRLTIHVNPFKAGHPLETGFALGELVFAILILRNARILSFPLPEFLDRPLMQSESMRRVGCLLVISAVLIFIGALISFGNSWRIGIDTETRGALITTGLFRISRNPIVVFLNLYLLGTFLIQGTILFLALALAGAAILHFQILREERFLDRHYGSAYREYRGRTPRYL